MATQGFRFRDQLKTPLSQSLCSPYLGGMKDLTQLMQQAQAMQQKLQDAQAKMADLNANDIEQATKIIEGSARSMGLQVVEG